MIELEDGTILLPLVEIHTFSGQLPYLQYYQRLRVSTHVTLSHDGGHTWTPFEALSFHGQSPSLLQTQGGVLLCAYRQRGPRKPQGVGLSYSCNGGERWAETDQLYLAPEDFWDCAYPNLIELSPGEYIAVYYTAALGTQFKDPPPASVRYADADNTIELLRFREHSERQTASPLDHDAQS